MPPSPPPSPRFAPIVRRRFFLLFLFLCLSLMLYPYTVNGGAGAILFHLLGSAVILLGVYAISFRRSLILFAALLAIPALLQHNLRLHADTSVLSLLGILFSLCFDVFIIVVIFRRVFRSINPEPETIFGALCVYLLIGFSFANVYAMLSALQPRAFYLDPATTTHAIPDRFDFIYFSFGSMTSLGSAGITAVSAQARSLSIMEAICGILYLAVLISHLIASYRYEPRPPDYEPKEK
jgi:hypothetical protein